ncbi:MAG: S9 family peptidase, partial [Caulobacteraceae bacterium]
HLALEQVNGAEAMAFVHAENERSLAALTGDPRYETFRREAEAILTATDRIAQPYFLGEGVGNFWQDATNPKGVWRRTSLAGYRSDSPQWETLLDIDALSRAEGKDWVFKGADCLAPDETRCLVNLSDGGKDAVVVREFDTTTKAFVDGGFNLPEGKHRIEWLDRGTLLVATDFGAGTLTESGYPYIVKTLERGQTLDQATEVYRGEQADGGYGVSPMVLRNDAGAVIAVLFNRPLDTFRSETWELVDGAPVKLNLPERVSVRGAMGPGAGADARLVFSLDEPWTLNARAFKPGSLVAANLRQLRPADAATQAISNADLLVFAPTDRQSVEDVAVFDDHVVATVLDNVRGRAISFRDRGEFGWPQTALDVPENTSVHLGSASRSSGRVFYNVEGFLTPSTLSLADVASGASQVLKSAPARFDASRDVVEQ